MDYFYDAQIKATLQQVMRVFCNFKYKLINSKTGKPELRQIPCRYGRSDKIVSYIQKGGSENTAISAPIFAVYIDSIKYDVSRLQNPNHENNLLVTERAFDTTAGKYIDNPGDMYHVQRFMPVPYTLTFKVDVLTTNDEQKFQIIEQVGLLFNPEIDFQINENPMDWTSLRRLRLTDLDYTSRSVPFGTDESLDIISYTFECQIELNPPAKVKRQIVIKNIIQNINHEEVSNDEIQTWQPEHFVRLISTPGDYHILLENGEVTLLGKGGTITDQNNNIYSWNKYFKLYDGELFEGKSLIRFRPGGEYFNSSADIFGKLFKHPTEENKLIVEIDETTLPSPSIPNINGVINPFIQNPYNNNILEIIGQRYLLLEDIPENNIAWGVITYNGNPVVAEKNDIIEFDGTNWFISFRHAEENYGDIVKDLSDGRIYVNIYDGWINAYEGEYNPGFWMLHLDSIKKSD